MNDKEKFATIKECRESGNELYRNGKIDEAEEKYRSALAIVEQLILKYDFVYLLKVFYIYVFLYIYLIIMYYSEKNQMMMNG